LKFKYNALNNSGKSVPGYIQAERGGAARSEIKRKGLYLAPLKEVSMRK
jgi:type II secretory pathway component PulF